MQVQRLNVFLPQTTLARHCQTPLDACSSFPHSLHSINLNVLRFAPGFIGMLCFSALSACDPPLRLRSPPRLAVNLRRRSAPGPRGRITLAHGRLAPGPLAPADALCGPGQGGVARVTGVQGHGAGGAGRELHVRVLHVHRWAAVQPCSTVWEHHG